jgi:hypothetical protein
MMQQDMIVTTTKIKPITKPEPSPIRNSVFEINAKIFDPDFPSSEFPPAQFD